jgi:hypothetical protein
VRNFFRPHQHPATALDTSSRSCSTTPSTPSALWLLRIACDKPSLCPRPSPAADIAMGLSKTNRILILLAIDSLFFLLEISVGQYSSALCGRPELTES